jgi:hypothetical protein
MIMMIIIIYLFLNSKICTRKPDEHIYVHAVWKTEFTQLTKFSPKKTLNFQPGQV